MRQGSDLSAGARAVAPMLVGVIPFGLVAGAQPTTEGLGGAAAVGLSTIVFAGASQLAAADVLADGGSATVATLAALTINLRMLLYSASISPFLAHVTFWRRMGAAYLLTDQAYAMSITRWSAGDEAGRRLAFYVGAGGALWVVWQLSTIAGIFIGGVVPDSLPLDFAVPLVFLVLLVPAITSRPAAVAAVSGGGVAVLAAGLGAGPLAVIAGALVGIACGAGADLLDERRRATSPDADVDAA